MADENPLATPVLSYDLDGNTNAENEIHDAIIRYRQVSHNARWSRSSRNKENWNFFHGRQDWSHKMKHQSQDFMPDFPMAMERIAGMFAKPFLDTETWFGVNPIGIGPAAARRSRSRSSVSGTQSHESDPSDTRSPGRSAEKKPIAAALTTSDFAARLPLRSRIIASVIC